MIRDGGFLWVKYALILSGVLLSTKQLHAEETMKQITLYRLTQTTHSVCQN